MIDFEWLELNDKWGWIFINEHSWWGDEVPLFIRGILNKFLHFFPKLLVWDKPLGAGNTVTGWDVSTVIVSTLLSLCEILFNREHGFATAGLYTLSNKNPSAWYFVRPA